MVKVKLMLAPLSELTTLSFRIIAKELGADLTFVPLVSSFALVYGNDKTRELVFEGKKEPGLKGIQIFGNNQEIIKKAVQFIDELNIYDIIDLNAGCPSRKIVDSGSGSALLKDLRLLRTLVRTIRENTKLKVSVKVRLGYYKNNIEEVVKAVEPFVDMIIIHGRVAKQGYSGKSDWDSIFRAKELTNKIVVGNGDIWSREDYFKVKDKVDAVMIGRAALRNPGIFSEIKYDKKASKSTILLRLVELEQDINALKKLSLFLISGLKNSKEFKRKITLIKDYDELKDYLIFLANEIKPE